MRDDFIRRSRDVQNPGDRQGGPRIAVIGMIEKRKAQDVFIQAAAMVRKVHSDAVFEIIGDTPANDTTQFKSKLTKQIESLGLTGCVRISAYRDDIVDCMLSHDIIVSSSIGLESLSLVMLEAMALGRVIVSTRHRRHQGSRERRRERLHRRARQRAQPGRRHSPRH